MAICVLIHMNWSRIVETFFLLNRIHFWGKIIWPMYMGVDSYSGGCFPGNVHADISHLGSNTLRAMRKGAKMFDWEKLSSHATSFCFTFILLHIISSNSSDMTYAMYLSKYAYVQCTYIHCRHIDMFREATCFTQNSAYSVIRPNLCLI